MAKKIIGLFLLFSSFVTSASDFPLIKSLVLCKPDFFQDIYNNKDELEKYTELKIFGKNQSNIPVPNRSDNSKSYVYFSKPIIYKDLIIKGYYDSAMDLHKIGKYYFWGFIIDNDIKQIKNTLNFVDWKEMEDNLLYIANPMIRSISDDVQTWHHNTGTVVGVKTIPAPDTTEKLLLLEKGENMTLLICSIQGVVTPELLKQERPDIQ